jgi:hypothetical protein
MTRRRILILIPDSRPDSSGEVWEGADIQLPTGLVPVAIDSRLDDPLAQVGNATVVKSPDGLIYADVAFSGNAGRPCFHYVLKQMRAYIIGDINGLEQRGHHRLIRKAVVKAIGFTMGLNADRRIPTLSAQGFWPDIPNPPAVKRGLRLVRDEPASDPDAPRSA